MSESDTPKHYSLANLKRWGEALDAEYPNGMGASLLGYADTWCKQLEHVNLELAEAQARRKELRDAIVWALGADGEFSPRADNQGAYWWRQELWKRAKLVWNGDEFLDCAAMASDPPAK